MSLYFAIFSAFSWYSPCIQSGTKRQRKQASYEGLGISELLAALAEEDQLLEHKIQILEERDERLQVR